jgi:peroxidase
VIQQQHDMASSTTGAGHSLLLALLLLSSAAHAQLSTSFYDTSCPSLQSIVRSVVSNAIASDRRMGASLARLFFHDCFVQVYIDY